jgi:predicted transcriptional regulator
VTGGVSKQTGRRPRGGLERQILACLSAAGRALTPGEVLAETDSNLAYTTVMTTLSRLHENGILDRQPAGRAYAYSLARDPAAPQSVAVAQRMRKLLEAANDRLLADLLNDLKSDDAALRDDGSAGDRGRR